MQHSVQVTGPNRYLIFDNGVFGENMPAEQLFQGRWNTIGLDHHAGTKVWEYIHPMHFLA